MWSIQAGQRCRVVAGQSGWFSWAGGTERAMVVDGYTWATIPGTDVEIRVLGSQPAALRYRPRR
jgi:hypothetical protein